MEDIWGILIGLGVLIYSFVMSKNKASEQDKNKAPKKPEVLTEEEDDPFSEKTLVMPEYAFEPEPAVDWISGYESYESLETIPVSEYSPLGANSIMELRNMEDQVAADVNIGKEDVQSNNHPDIDLKKAIIYQTILERKYV